MPAYSREDWNDIIRRVNDLAANPPPDTDCDPLPALDEVDPEHIWSKSDIEAVRDKLTAICEDNTWSGELRLWAQSVLDEIEEAIGRGWCGCEEDDGGCVPQCSNAQGRVEQYQGSYELVDYEYCGVCPGDGSCWDNCTIEARDAVEDKGYEARSAGFSWASKWREYCIAAEECEDLQEQLDRATDPAEIASLTAQLTAKQGERDAAQSAADSFKSQADSLAAESMSMLDGVDHSGQDVLYSSFVNGVSAPWADTACDQLGPDCLGKSPSRCASGAWNVQTKLTDRGAGGYVYVGNWITVAGGYFTPNGQPYCTNVRYCGGTSSHYCGSCCGPTEVGCTSGNCGPDTLEIRTVIFYPYPRGEECC